MFPLVPTFGINCTQEITYGQITMKLIEHITYQGGRSLHILDTSLALLCHRRSQLCTNNIFFILYVFQGRGFSMSPLSKCCFKGLLKVILFSNHSVRFHLYPLWGLNHVMDHKRPLKKWVEHMFHHTWGQSKRSQSLNHVTGCQRAQGHAVCDQTGNIRHKSREIMYSTVQCVGELLK